MSKKQIKSLFLILFHIRNLKFCYSWFITFGNLLLHLIWLVSIWFVKYICFFNSPYIFICYTKVNFFKSNWHTEKLFDHMRVRLLRSDPQLIMSSWLLVSREETDRNYIEVYTLCLEDKGMSICTANLKR